MMKFTLAWLKEHLDTDHSLGEIVDKLTMIGLEVERVEDKAALLAPYVIARVVEAKPHPNADRLRVCMVDTGTGDPVQVVCGAPNARTGMKGVFVPPGAFIPGKNMTLAVGTIRGVESRGMLVSEFELQLSDDHEGIIELPDDAPVGESFAAWKGLDDPVIEINLTPNRADCTGVHGVARDLAAADMGKFKDAGIKPIKGEFPCPVSVTLDFGATPSLCPAFALRLVRGVKNGPSPEWMQRRLTAIGLRPINALVDITNFITYDRGRPLHVFDAAKVRGNLVVRRGRDGETLTALDGKTYTLDDSVCVIADEDGVESLAGIMGGEKTGCSETTTDVLIESALWDEINIARTGRKLGINSDARYRFERGVDPNFMLPGLELATKMVVELCGGTPSEITVAGKAEAPERIIDFPLSELKRLAGLEASLIEVRRVLEHLGFFVAGQGEKVKIAVPSWRADVAGQGRHRRGDRAHPRRRSRAADAVRPRRGAAQAGAHADPGAHTQGQARARRARPHRGGDVVVHRQGAGGIVRRRQARACARQSDRGGPFRHAAESHSRPRRRRAEECRPRLSRMWRCSRSARCFAALSRRISSRPLPACAARWRKRRASAGIGPRRTARSMPSMPRPMRSPCLLARARRAQALQIMPGGPAWYHPGRSGTIQIGPQNVLGHFGELHPSALEALDADGPLVAFEVILERIPEPKAKPTRAKPALELSPFQPVERDFAFVVERSVKAADIVRAAQSADRKLITGITVFDVYEGAGIEPGKKSIAIAVTLQPREKTMTDAEIDALAAKIVAEVGKKTGGVLRA